jgi:hypothetical protein
MSAERDPRVDPESGDQVTFNQRLVRQVTLAIRERVAFIHLIDGRPVDAEIVSLEEWQEWARGAEVVQRGEESR